MSIISVIVPCYNVEKYLERCIYSIIGQTYSKLEIILVDDGSTDGTGDMCDKFAQIDSRIKVVHKPNGGLSDARNAGIDVAQGEFYAFVDGDDYLELDTYEKMISEMKDDISLVSAGIISEDINGNKSIKMSKEFLILDKKEAFLNLLGPIRTIGQSSCNKLFRKYLFSDLRYKKGIINEDMEILPKILDSCEKVVLLDKPVYHYVKRTGSITESEFSMWKYQGIDIAYDTLALCRDKYPDLIPYANYYVMDALFKMYYELVNCKNRKTFQKQEYELRVKIVKEFFQCIKQKSIMIDCGDKIKSMMITAFLGVEMTQKLVKIKREIVGIKGK